MLEHSATPLTLFYCYAHQDLALRDELDKHLALLKRSGKIVGWYDHEIAAGGLWEKDINEHLNAADIILLLVSPDFMASDYCYGIEMVKALERHIAEQTQVIPVLLRPVYWKNAPFSSLQRLPSGAKPVTRWKNRDDAFEDITQRIADMIEELIAKRAVVAPRQEQLTSSQDKLSSSTDDYCQQGYRLIVSNRYDEALILYDQALHLNPNDAHASYHKGFVLHKLGRSREALRAYSLATRLGLRFDATNLFVMDELIEQAGLHEEAERFRIKADDVQDTEFWFSH